MKKCIKLSPIWIIVIVLIALTVILGVVLWFCNTTKVGCGRLTDKDLAVIDHFQLLSSDSLLDDLKEKSFVITEDTVGGKVPNTTTYVFDGTKAENQNNEWGLEYYSLTVSDEGEIKSCSFRYYLMDLKDERFASLVKTYCKAANTKWFSASYFMPKLIQQISFNGIVDMPLPGSEESKQQEMKCANSAFVTYHFNKYKLNDSSALTLMVYDTGEVRLMGSWDVGVDLDKLEFPSGDNQ